jgi:hypothetical protein
MEHYPGNSGGNGNSASTTIANAASQFHVRQYGSPASVTIYVDDVLFHSVANTASLPFNKDFLLYLMCNGGTFWRSNDPAFTQSSMEIDM